MITYEKEVMCCLDRGKSKNIKNCQESKQMKKIVKLIEGINKDIPPPMDKEGATKSDSSDILR